MQKRGISPLIATILLIGFTIVLAALIMVWGTDLFKNLQEEQGTKAETELICASKILPILKGACSTINPLLDLEIKNEGQQEISSYIIRVKSSQTSKTINGKSSIGSYGVIKQQIPVPNMGIIQEVDIIPYVKIQNKEKSCSPVKVLLDQCSGIDLSTFGNQYSTITSDQGIDLLGIDRNSDGNIDQIYAGENIPPNLLGVDNGFIGLDQLAGLTPSDLQGTSLAGQTFICLNNGKICTHSQTCDTSNSANPRCVNPNGLADGASCTLDPECYGTFCNDGICGSTLKPKANGRPCTQASECLGNNCNNNLCSSTANECTQNICASSTEQCIFDTTNFYYKKSACLTSQSCSENTCKKANGEACATAGECAGGFCNSLICADVPQTPTNIVGVKGTPLKITLSWDAVAGAESYKIYKGTSPGGEAAIAIANPATNNYVDTSVSEGSTYYYQITAIAKTKESLKSAEYKIFILFPTILNLQFNDPANYLKDLSGNSFIIANHGVQFINDGAHGGIASFDGNSYIQIEHNLLLNLQDSWTIEFWISPSITHRGMILNKYSLPAAQDSWAVYNYQTQIKFYYATTLQDRNWINALDNIQQQNSWQHIVLVGNNGVLTSYRNGEIYYTVFPFGPITPGTTPLYIGVQDPLTGTYYFNGKLDNIRIYSKALITSEVQSLYQNP